MFLFYATMQDIQFHAVERYVFIVWGMVAIFGWMLGGWPISPTGAVLGFVLLSLAGVLSGDRWGGALVGLLMGPMVAVAVIIALVTAWLTWRRWGQWRSPADFAFYPFLSIGVALTIGYQLVSPW
jgi:hypothetical protein